MKLQGKWALVTGSSRGIGRQIALGLAAEGCNVIVHGRTMANTEATTSLLKANYPNVHVHAVEGDLGQPDGAENVSQAVLDLVEDIDILYNNAAISVAGKDIWSFTTAEWQQVFQVNLYSMVELCNVFAPRMKARKWGRIVNLSSGIKDQPQYAPYSVSKAAVDKFTQDLSYALKDDNVLVNFLDPGWLRTDLGGPNAMHDVKDVLPGALVPALLEDNGATGQFFAAQSYR